MTQGDDKDELPEIHAQRVAIEGDRYLIYYTFSNADETPEGQATDLS